MRNVLIISFLFNQTEYIGTIRLRGLVKYLPEFGWNPIVLTAKTSAPPSKKYRVFETPYQDTTELWKNRLGIPMDKKLKEYYHLPHTDKQKKSLIDILIDLWSEIFTYPDRTINWSISAIEKGDELLKEHQFDAILSSIRPCTSHIVANELVKREKDGESVYPSKSETAIGNQHKE